MMCSSLEIITLFEKQTYDSELFLYLILLVCTLRLCLIDYKIYIIYILKCLDFYHCFSSSDFFFF